MSQIIDGVEKAIKELIMDVNNMSIMYNIDWQSFYPFTLRTWIGDSGASWYVTNDPIGFYKTKQ